jgi:hypothetical protein
MSPHSKTDTEVTSVLVSSLLKLLGVGGDQEGCFFVLKDFFILNFYKNRRLVLDLRGTIRMSLKNLRYATLFSYPL